MSRNPLVSLGIVGGVIGSLAFMVAEGAASHPIGQSIPEKRLELRQEGAQAESVRSGKKTVSEAADQVDVKIAGGDKGMKEVP